MAYTGEGHASLWQRLFINRDYGLLLWAALCHKSVMASLFRLDMAGTGPDGLQERS